MESETEKIKKKLAEAFGFEMHDSVSMGGCVYFDAGSERKQKLYLWFLDTPELGIYVGDSTELSIKIRGEVISASSEVLKGLLLTKNFLESHPNEFTIDDARSYLRDVLADAKLENSIVKCSDNIDEALNDLEGPDDIKKIEEAEGYFVYIEVDSAEAIEKINVFLSNNQQQIKRINEGSMTGVISRNKKDSEWVEKLADVVSFPSRNSDGQER